MKNILIFIITLILLTCIGCSNHSSHQPSQLFVIDSISLIHVSTKMSKPDFPTGLTHLDSIFTYDVHLSNLSNNSDTSISVHRNFRYDTSNYIGDTISIRNNELYSIRYEIRQWTHVLNSNTTHTYPLSFTYLNVGNIPPNLIDKKQECTTANNAKLFI